MYHCSFTFMCMSTQEIQYKLIYELVQRKTECFMLTGYAAGPLCSQGGGGSNFLCLPQDPDWDNFKNESRYVGYIAAVEYELVESNNVFSTSNTGGIPLYDNPAPCAVCYLDHRLTVLMIPAKTQCPDGWNKEYGGYLASEHSHRNRKRSSYVCWDRAPEVADGKTGQNHAVIYPVKAVCGSLPCSAYVNGRDLTCVVCSKWKKHKICGTNINVLIWYRDNVW